MKLQIFYFTAALTFCLTSLEFKKFVALSREIEATKEKTGIIGNSHFSTKESISNKGLEESISGAAKSSHIKNLLSVSSNESLNSQTIQLEYEGNQTSILQFLDTLQYENITGPCQRLQMSAYQNNDGLIRAQALFDRTKPNSVPPNNQNRKVMAMPSRNIFIPLWKDSDQSVNHTPLVELKKQEEEQKKEHERMDQERKLREEENRIQSIRRDLETQLTVTGIVNNGKESLAFVNARMGNNQTVMVRGGDSIAQARVVTIDEKRGEVLLDYLGKFQVLLKLSAPITAN